MDDIELGRKIVWGNSSINNERQVSWDYASIGARARALLAKPVARPEAVSAFLEKNTHLMSVTSKDIELAMKLLSHFAPPARPRMMIEGMSVAEIERAMKEERNRPPAPISWDHCDAARVAHRLANTPAPEVDEHAAAKDALWRYWCAVPDRNPHASKEAAWREATHEDQSRWINFAAMEKGNE